jgi:TldD protein
LRERLEAVLRQQSADYLEIHIEEKETTHLQCQDGELEEIRRNVEYGGNVRALVRGGWGFVSFNDLTRLEEFAALAVAQARRVGQTKSILAPVEPVVDAVPLQWIKSPRAVPLVEKKRLFAEYHQAMLDASSFVQTTFADYSETERRLTFANSEGTRLEQGRGDIVARFIALAADGDNAQNAHVSLGSADDYGAIENRHRELTEAVRQAEARLQAKPVRGGAYTVILDPELASVFIHEAFGHLSEADTIYEDERARALMAPGRRLGPPDLNVVDGPTGHYWRGWYQYDDEGTPSAQTDLIRNGILVGRLHSRQTAGSMGESATGNARAVSYRFPPIVRMSNTFIEPSRMTLEEMMADIRQGLYLKGSYGGETSLDTFTFSAAAATMIRNGQLAEPRRGVELAGNVFEFLANIESIGNDLTYDQTGTCDKGPQVGLPVCSGSPHIRVRNVVIAS